MEISTIIAAAGQGKRLYSESLEVPKPLFFYQDKPIIANLIDTYREISDDIVVVVSSNDLGNLLKSWLMDYYESPSWLKIVEQPFPAGTNNAVNIAKKYIKYNKCIVSWSDFLIEKQEFISKIQNENVFFTSNVDCRFGLENNKIIEKSSNPGFIGIYYFNNLPELDLSKDDFIENFIGKEIDTDYLNVINLGNVAELVKNNAFTSKSNRYFNSIEYKNDFVYKYAKTNHATDLQLKEVNWYNNCSPDLKKYVPSFEFDKTNSILKLERIYGRPISQCKLDSEFWRKKLPKLINDLHFGSFPVDKKSCLDTYIKKPKQRFEKVKNIIDTWFSKSKIINGIDFSNFTLPEIPNDLFPKEFTFIHGDLQFSNSMLDLNGNIKMIDPRGYFGETDLYGDPAYDIAKLLYAVDAYHKINENKFSIHKLSNNQTILIHEPDISINSDVRYFFDFACEKHNISKEKLNFLLFGIWLSLSSYIINCPLAIIASYSKALIRSREFII